MPERLEVQRAVAASAGEIFAVLTDPRGHVAIDSSGMLMEASGDIVAKVGDTFVVHMDREALNDYPLGLYDVTVEIVTFEPDQEIAWTVHGQSDLGHVYGYRLEPVEDGTLVTSYYDWSAADQAWKDAAHLPGNPGERTAGHARDPDPHCRSRQAPPRALILMTGILLRWLRDGVPDSSGMACAGVYGISRQGLPSAPGRLHCSASRSAFPANRPTSMCRN